MMIRFARSGGTRPPRDREILTIEEDGSFTMWRSIGSATQPPTPVGRFAGQVDDRTLAALSAAAEAVSLEGDLSVKPKPGSAIVNIETDRVKARMGLHDEPEGPWTVLAMLLKGLLGELTESPEAAVTLDVSEDGKKARLVHLGQQPLELDFSRLEVRAVLWEGHLKVGDWSASGGLAGANELVTAGIDWQMVLPFGHPFDPHDDQRVVAYVTFAIAHEGRFIPVKLTSS